MKLLHRLFVRRNSNSRVMKNRAKTNGRPSLARKRFFVEPLEGRLLLAGDVVGTVGEFGDLHVTGDARGNNISIYFDATHNSTFISGLNTTINNGTSPVDLEALGGFPGLPENLSVDTGGGNDSISIDGIAIDGNLTVTGGDGNDQISVTNTKNLS